MRIVSCIFDQHSLWMVGVAGIVCALGSWTSMRLYAQIRRTDAYAAGIFLCAVTVGATIWCTHFVAMTAYQPGIPLAFDPAFTALSLLIAIIAPAIGLVVGTQKVPHASTYGGCVLGFGIAAMHYSGMMAVTVSAYVEWNLIFVLLSIASAMMFGALALHCSDAYERQSRAVAAFFLGIVSLHFSGMAAVTIIPMAPLDADVSFQASHQFLGIAIAGVGLLVVGTGVASHVVDQQLRTQGAQRQHQLLETSVDCIVIVHDDIIAEVNSAFETLVGLTRDSLLGKPLGTWLVAAPQAAKDQLYCALLRAADGTAVPVEVAQLHEAAKAAQSSASYFSIRDLRPRLAQEQKIVSLAHTDTLTGLANRYWAREQLVAALSQSDGAPELALLFLDLDRFKQINDSLGHQVGDELLRSVAKRIQQSVRKGDLVARIGGDEFAIVLRDAEHSDTIQAIAMRIIEALSEPFSLCGYSVRVSASVGIALSPKHGTCADDLLQRADIAMYKSKSMGGGQFSLFEDGMDEMMRARLKLESDLRIALEHGQFELHYQPQVCAKTHTIVSFEALLRWRHPDRGLVPPLDFIPLAEEIGLMNEIGSWVVHQACADAVTWAGTIGVAVNVSSCQFDDVNLDAKIRRALIASGLPPQRLEIEITESLFLTDAERVINTLNSLRAMGIKIAMDDFGTGYSSLSYLIRFPMDKVKIDRAFVKDAESVASRGIIRAIIGLANSLQMATTAEGVETLEQVQLLEAEGCKLLQGYYFSKPVRAGEIQALIANASSRVAA